MKDKNKKKKSTKFLGTPLKKGFFVGGMLALFIFILSLFPMQYEIIAPGKINSVASEVEILNDKETNLNLNSVSVYSFYKPSYFISSFIELSNKVETIQLDEDFPVSTNENYIMGQIDKESAHNNALINAYKLASKKSNLFAKPLEYEITGLTVYYSSPNIRKKLPIGLVFDYYNGEKITEDFFNYTKEQIDGFVKNGITFQNREKGEEVIISGTEFEHGMISVQRKIKIDEEKARPKFKINDKSYGGPSGGFIQTLYIYLKLLGKNIPNKIAATGAIKYDGSIGNIGGLIQKIHTVAKQKCEYFFIPNDNYQRERDSVDKLKEKYPKLKIKPINTFDDAIDYLISEGVIK